MLNTSLERDVINGFYRGTVLKHCTNGKCKIWIPSIYPEDSVTTPDILPDAELASPLFGGSCNGSGIFSYPRIGSSVWCFFQNGDLNFPIYFAACNGGPEADNQYNYIGTYEKFGEYHNNVIDTVDKISDASVHKINTSRASMTFYEDGTYNTKICKNNALTTPLNVNLPYSKTNSIFNALNSDIFSGMIEEAEYISNSTYSIHTTDLISGLNNDCFALTCIIKTDPAVAYSMLTSQIDSNESLQCRSVYSKDYVANPVENTKIVYYETPQFIPILTFKDVFLQLYSEDDIVDPAYLYVFNLRPNSLLYASLIEKEAVTVGTTLQVKSENIKAKDITKNNIRILLPGLKVCKTFIASEDCKIDKWKYIKDNQFNLYLCSPSEFDNPVLYFDKPLYNGYPAQCPIVKWPGLVDPKSAQYKVSIVLIEDRRKYLEHEVNKDGIITTLLSDSYDESILSTKINANGEFEALAYKQNYLNYNIDGEYKIALPTQANISGYSVTNMYYNNCTKDLNAVLSLQNYLVRLHTPEDSSQWWHYNSFVQFDLHNGLSILNDTLSIDSNPKYFAKKIDNLKSYPRWEELLPLAEQISSNCLVNLRDGTALFGINHLEDYDVFNFSRLSSTFAGGISVENTNQIDLFITDTRHKDGFTPYVKNIWTYMNANKNGELSVHETKSFQLSVNDPYDLFNKSVLQCNSEGQVSLNNTKSIDILTYTPAEKQEVSTEDWPPKKLEEPAPPLHYSRFKFDKDGHIKLDCSQDFEFRTSPNHKIDTWEPDLTTLPRSHFKFDGNEGTITTDCCNQITIESTNGNIDILNTDKGDINIKTPSGTITVTNEGGDLIMNITGKLSIKTTDTTYIDANGGATIKAPDILLDGNVEITGNLKSDLNVDVIGNVTANGEVAAGGGSVTLTGHKHPEMQSGDVVSPGVMTGAGVG